MVIRSETCTLDKDTPMLIRGIVVLINKINIMSLSFDFVSNFHLNIYRTVSPR